MKDNKNKNIGCLTGLLGTLVVILCVVVYAVVSSLINNLFVSLRLGESADCALLPMTMTGITVAFVLYEIVFVLWLVKVGRKGSEDEKKTSRIFKIALVSAIAASLLFACVGANTYTRLSDDSISKVCLVEYEKYEWGEKNNVMRYTLACGEDGRLSYTVTMKDGEKIELFSAVNSCTDEFVEKYETLYGYAAYLSSEFESNENAIIEGRIIGKEYMEKYYKDTDSVIWKYLYQIINGAEK